jgi:hypothetical protein
MLCVLCQSCLNLSLVTDGLATGRKIKLPEVAKPGLPHHVLVCIKDKKMPKE